MGIIATTTREGLTAIGKSLFHSQRCYRTLLQLAWEQGLPESELTALEAWLPQGKINQKRLDALAMLRSMREFLATDLPPKQPGYRFAATSAWEKINIPALPVPPGAGHDSARLPLDSLLDELRLAGISLPREQKARLHALLALNEALFDAHLIEHLGTLCDYSRLAGRALDKQAVLAAGGILQATLDELPLAREALVAWYFEQRRKQPVPPDLESYSQHLGFASDAAFYSTLAGEYLYLAK